MYIVKYMLDELLKNKEIRKLLLDNSETKNHKKEYVKDSATHKVLCYFYKSYVYFILHK